jgi:hypothetical protein
MRLAFGQTAERRSGVEEQHLLDDVAAALDWRRSGPHAPTGGHAFCIGRTGVDARSRFNAPHGHALCCALRRHALCRDLGVRSGKFSVIKACGLVISLGSLLRSRIKSEIDVPAVHRDLCSPFAAVTVNSFES